MVFSIFALQITVILLYNKRCLENENFSYKPAVFSII